MKLQSLYRIRICIGIVIFGLFLSGITAFPIETELLWLLTYSEYLPDLIYNWLNTVHQAIHESNQKYPFLSYGTDWLAFAHLVLAILFIGPFKDPVKNIWVIEFGMISCILILPLALIAGSIRGIPFYWRLIDCSFGVIGIIPLWFAYKMAKKNPIQS